MRVWDTERTLQLKVIFIHSVHSIHFAKCLCLTEPLQMIHSKEEQSIQIYLIQTLLQQRRGKSWHLLKTAVLFVELVNALWEDFSDAVTGMTQKVNSRDSIKYIFHRKNLSLCPEESVQYILFGNCFNTSHNWQVVILPFQVTLQCSHFPVIFYCNIPTANLSAQAFVKEKHIQSRFHFP